MADLRYLLNGPLKLLTSGLYPDRTAEWRLKTAATLASHSVLVIHLSAEARREGGGEKPVRLGYPRLFLQRVRCWRDKGDVAAEGLDDPFSEFAHDTATSCRHGTKGAACWGTPESCTSRG